ncbi:MAG: carboxypeptidase regulatory-like domain-containing protein [Cyanobacteria bacterium P01_H01_bin.58]
MKNQLLALTLGATTVLSTATVAHSHAVQTDYFVDLFAEQVELELTATYSSGEPMEEATVLVYAPGEGESPWQEGQTDELGNFTFVPDESLAGDWKIHFQQAGHEDILIVPVDDQGIDYINISHGPNTDVHYATIAPGWVGMLPLIGLGVLMAVLNRRSA